MNKVTVVIADDHEIVRDGLRLLFNQEDWLEIVGEARTGRSAVQFCADHQPDVAIVDIAMPELNGIETTRQIVKVSPDTKVIILSMHSEKNFVTKSITAGAKGYLLKNSAFGTLREAIRKVMQGEFYLSPAVTGVLVENFVEITSQNEQSDENQLSPREKEVLQLFAENKPMKEIADCLNISVKTAETHRRRIMQKLGLNSTVELVKYAIREGLTTTDF